MNRGGSWNNNPRNARVANRNRNTPDNRDNNLGLRLVSTARPASPRATVRSPVAARFVWGRPARAKDLSMLRVPARTASLRWGRAEHPTWPRRSSSDPADGAFTAWPPPPPRPPTPSPASPASTSFTTFAASAPLRGNSGGDSAYGGGAFPFLSGADGDSPGLQDL